MTGICAGYPENTEEGNLTPKRGGGGLASLPRGIEAQAKDSRIRRI